MLRDVSALDFLGHGSDSCGENDRQDIELKLRGDKFIYARILGSLGCISVEELSDIIFGL